MLPRIGLCYLAAASLYRWCASRPQSDDPVRRDVATARVVAVAAAALLLGYWAVIALVPGESGRTFDMTAEGNVGAMIDRALLGGHLWKPRWDPEGLLSTLPAIATTLLGVLAGLWFRNAGSLGRRAAGLAVGGAMAAAVGLAWHLVLPLNKSLWTSSYAVFTAGLGAIVLAACVWLVDMRGWTGAAHPFVVLGTNAMALFALSGLIAKTLLFVKVSQPDGSETSLQHAIYEAAFVPLASPYNASLLYALANLAVLYVILWVMFKRGIFWKM